jgi:hypothetical protein
MSIYVKNVAILPNMKNNRSYLLNQNQIPESISLTDLFVMSNLFSGWKEN